MKRMKSVLGVTLLEIMLVLAIAAMIIVMSVRYYQSATNSQQSTAAMNEILAIAAAMDTLSMSTSTYSSIGANPAAVGSALKSYLGTTALTTPSGGAITVTVVNASSYTIALALSPAVCASVSAQIKSNSKITVSTPCNNGLVTLTYNRST